jgi:hypothetical protein
MIEDLTKKKLEQYGFDKESIKRLFTWENYECALTSNRGYFWASNKEKKIYSGKEGKEKHFSRSILPEHHKQPKEKFETFEDLFQYATLVGSIERPKTNYLYSAKRSQHNFTFNLWLQDYKGWEYGNGEMYIEFLTREYWVEYLKHLEEEDSKLKQKAAHLKANWQPQQQNNIAINIDCKNEKKCSLHFITEITDLCATCSIREKVKSVRDNMISKYEFLAKNNTKDFLNDYLKNNIITANNKIENIFNKENTVGNLHRSGRVSILLSYKDCLKYYNEQQELLNVEKIQVPDHDEYNTMFNLLGLYRNSHLQPTSVISEMINPPNISTALIYHIPQVLQKHNLTPLIAAELLDRLKSVHKKSIIRNIVTPIINYLRNNESVLIAKKLEQKETEQLSNDLTKSTIEDYLQPFEKKINPSSYINLVEYLKEYFDTGKFPVKINEIKINKIPKKAFGWALTEIFRACKTNNEPLTYEYLEFGKKYISIFKTAELRKENMNKCTLYKYYTTKTVVK